MKKFISSSIILFSIVLFSNNSLAQYRTGIGGHFGHWMGLSVKTYMNTNSDQSMEGLVIWDNDTRRATGIYAWNKSVRAPGMNVSGLNWHYGVGLHVGLIDKGAVPVGESRAEYGLDAQLGVELLWGEIPFSIGVDVNPFYNIPPNSRPWSQSINAALIIRYLLK